MTECVVCFTEPGQHRACTGCPAVCSTCLCGISRTCVAAEQSAFPPTCVDFSCHGRWSVRKLYEVAAAAGDAELAERINLSAAFREVRRACAEGQAIRYCPHPDCSAPYPSTDLSSEGELAECLVCRRGFCGGCFSRYHGEGSCEEARAAAERSSERCGANTANGGSGGELPPSTHEMTSAQLAAFCEDQGWQRCHQCSSAVEKNGGCNHMTCRCGAEWCWRCKTPYRRSSDRSRGARACSCDIFDRSELPPRRSQRQRRQEPPSAPALAAPGSGAGVDDEERLYVVGPHFDARQRSFFFIGFDRSSPRCYSDFAALHRALVADAGGRGIRAVLEPLPPKLWLHRVQDLAHRRAALEAFLRSAVANRRLLGPAAALALDEFVGVRGAPAGSFRAAHQRLESHLQVNFDPRTWFVRIFDDYFRI
eukprot:CAMPEP_0170144686 /NCGR_PEP_ID=MMETSP0033_2-20121228/15325_1 /TAXON_ID=195969 /ORGANISM="Dolichomastix tenuilepis, Strain CCMP3274" /LENGTH=422 /DNA_ID=CAMNT_0010381207 /DNA_START=24 /DNA_END=1292 /DNA_ORIENTATION=+